MSVAPDTIRVCPSCGTAAEAHEYCAGCGLHLATLPELPTRTEWQAAHARPPSTVTPVASTSTMPEGETTSIRPLLHPTERSRLILAIGGAALAVVIIILVAVAAHNASFLLELVGILVFSTISIWFTQQLLRARLLGRSVRVSAETLPALQSLLDEVAATLQYRRRVDVYVVDNAGAPISMSSYLGTRIIVIEGSLVAELLENERRPQMVFLIGRSIGALRAKHTRLDLIVVLLQAIDALKFVSPLLRPWYRAITYSGDQIGMVCCDDMEAALHVTRRLLVGGELASGLDSGAVIPQAYLVQNRLMPRLVQIFASTPHITNRYANLLCFGRYHDPEAWHGVRASMDEGQTRILEQLWERSPYRRREAGLARNSTAGSVV
jgi:hypothetical protein